MPATRRSARWRSRRFHPHMARPHHNVYWIELSRDVLRQSKLRQNNTGYIERKPYVYVGIAEPQVSSLLGFLYQAAQGRAAGGHVKKHPDGLHLPVCAAGHALESVHHAIGAAHFPCTGRVAEHLGVGR